MNNFLFLLFSYFTIDFATIEYSSKQDGFIKLLEGDLMQQENWLPLLDYAVINGLSTSTLRRYIKAKKVNFKIEKGRYLILSEKNAAKKWDAEATQDSISVFTRTRELEDRVKQLEEQNSELKMLVALYEDKLGKQA